MSDEAKIGKVRRTFAGLFSLARVSEDLLYGTGSSIVQVTIAMLFSFYFQIDLSVLLFNYSFAVM